MKSIWLKEWRSHRSFVVGVIVLGLLGFLLIAPWFIDQSLQRRLVGVRPFMEAWLLILVVCSGVAFGATTVAEEKENKTYGLIERLPTHPFDVWAGKAMFAWSATAVVFVALLVLYGILAARQMALPLSAGRAAALCRVVLSAALLGWATGVLFSPLCKQVLTSCVAAGALTFLLEALVGACARGQSEVFLRRGRLDTGLPLLPDNWGAVLCRLLLVAVIACVSYWLFCGPVERRQIRWWGR